MSHKRFADAEGYVRHCWECAHSYGWDRNNTGICSVSGHIVEKYQSPSNPASGVGGCIHYRYLDKPEPMTNDERYRRVCDLLEEALQLMSEWKENE